MNQPTTPASPMRSGGPVDSPDIVFILRRYAWLIVAGAILGTAVASGLFVYFRKTAPRYTAEVTFQALPPPPSLGLANAAYQAPFSAEDINLIILRQMEVIKSNDVLDAALHEPAFQFYQGKENPTRKSDWLDQHPVQPKFYLKNDMSLSPQLNAGIFRMSMTTKNQEECASLVNAIAKVYIDFLKVQNKEATNERLADLQNVEKQQRDKVAVLSSTLDDFRKSNSVTQLMAMEQRQMNWLGTLDQDYSRAESAAKSAEAHWNAIDAQIKADKPLVISDEMMASHVERDSEMFQLQITKISLEQQLTSATTGGAQGAQMAQKLEAQMKKNDEQISARRKTLEEEARKLMKERAKNDADQLRGVADYYKGERDAQDRLVRDLDYNLVKYRAMEEDYKSQEQILLNLQSQNRLESLKSVTDEARVRILIPATIPDRISWPIWYTFVPIGTAGGLALSFLLAYLLVLTDTRIRTPRDITRVLQLPMLGFVPDESDDSALKGEIATAIRTSATSMTAESYRQIRSQLTAVMDSSPVSTMLVASIAPGGGATTVASNIAAGMALNGLRVLLVDANFYRPGLRNIYKDMPETGLSDVISTPSMLDAAIMPCEELPKLHLMSAGTHAESTSCEILESKPFREMLDKLKTRYEMVIFDGAPLNLVSDSLTLAGRVDGVIAVVRAGEVSRGTVTRVRDQLRQVRANLLGFVLNAAQTSAAGYFKENYRTFYRYAGQSRRQTVAAR